MCPDGITRYLCPAGYVCPPGTQSTASAQLCPAGFVCPVGTEVPLPAPAGQFTLKGATGSIALTGISAPGFFCPGACSSPFGEPNGGICPAGTYCPPASVEPTFCDAGTYSNETGRSTPCNPCPVGRFNPDTGGASLAACRFCSKGLSTLRTGTTTREGCLSTAFTCPAGLTPNVTVPRSLADCEPIVCPIGFILSPDRFYCEGACPANEACCDKNPQHLRVSSFFDVETLTPEQIPCFYQLRASKFLPL